MTKLILTSVGTSLLDPEKQLLERTPADGKGALGRLNSNLANASNIDLDDYLKTGQENYFQPAEAESKMVDGLSGILFPECTNDYPDSITPEAASEIRDELQKINPGFPNRFSAEIASLFHIFDSELNSESPALPLQSGKAKIVLLASDSLDGCFCTRVNKRFIEKYICTDVVVVRIEDLQARDSERFSKGLSNLRKEVEKVLSQDENKGFEMKILNMTGGFKATITYAAILAWAKGLRLQYLFESGDHLIDITQPDNLALEYDQLLSNIELGHRGPEGALGNAG